MKKISQSDRSRRGRGGFPTAAAVLAPVGKPPRPRCQGRLRDILLIARPPLLAVMQGGEFRFIQFIHTFRYPRLYSSWPCCSTHSRQWKIYVSSATLNRNERDRIPLDQPTRIRRNLLAAHLWNRRVAGTRRVVADLFGVSRLQADLIVHPRIGGGIFGQRLRNYGQLYARPDL